MSDDEAVANVLTLQIAGTETTATNLTHTVMLLQEDRARWNAVAADPSLIPNAFEETLRFFPPLRAQPRRVTHDTELSGVKIPAGARLLWMITSANRDEEVFDHPDDFDLYRKNNRDHLTFGSFAHFCIGAPLARLESTIALECLVERLPDLRIRPGQTVEYPPNPMFNRPLSLRVEW
jgi:cytochrome P450